MKVGVVTPIYTLDSPHWVDLVVADYVEQLKQRHQLTVITTTASRSNQHEFAAGVVEQGSMTTVRHKADDALHSTSVHLNYVRESGLACDDPSTKKEGNSIFSDELINFVVERKAEFDALLYFAESYYPLLLGLPQVADKAFLVSPTKQPEPAQFIKMYAPLFHSLRGIAFFSNEDRQDVNEVYPLPKQVLQTVCGRGFDIKRIDQKVTSPDILYFDKGEGDTQVQVTFAEMKKEYGAPGQLIVVKDGKSWHEALAQGARVVVIPGKDERWQSLAFEAWQWKTPVIIDAGNHEARRHCDLSGGGTYFHSAATLRGLMTWHLYYPEEAAIIGGHGSNFVEKHCNWAKVMTNLEEMLSGTGEYDISKPE
jgi:hypothetical protein